MVLAVLAAVHGVSLGDLVLASQALVLLGLSGLDGDLDAGDAVSAKPNRVAGALTNCLLDLILVELAVEALRANHRLDDFVAELAAFKEDSAATIVLHDVLDGVPEELVTGWFVLGARRAGLLGAAIAVGAAARLLGQLLDVSRLEADLGLDAALGGAYYRS